MKLRTIIEATKVQEGSNDSYYAYHDAAEKWAKDTGQPKEKFAYAGTDVQDEYIEPEMKKYGLVPDSYQGKGVTKYRREDVNEGEERSIIHDGCVDKLVDEFRGEEHQFENMGDLEYAIYSELERLDVEDCVDPDEEHGGQRMGDFASGGVLNVIDSSSVIDDVVAQLDVSELEEGITTKHSYDPVKPGGQSKPRKPVPLKGQKVTLGNVVYKVTHVSADRKTFDVVNVDDDRERHIDMKVDNNPFFIEGKSPHKKGSAKYKKHMAAMHAESEEEGRWAIYIDGKDAQVRFKDYVDAGEMENKMKKKHPSKKIELKKVGLNEVSDKDADQIIKQIISAYGIDKLEQVFREYFPRLSDEQVDKFLKDYRRSQLKVVNNEDVDLNDGMIGEPDRYYDEEDRKQAYQEMQDALERCDRTEAQYVKDGICPNCAGSGYADADYEEEEDSCDGWGNYGCDEGEMTFRNDECSWAEIIKSDKRNADRQQAKDNYPGDEEVINQIRNMVMGMEDPRMAMQQMAIDYPHMGRAQRASLVAKGMKAAGLTNEGQRCWKGYEKKGTKMMFGKRVNNCVKKEGTEMNENAPVEKIKSPMTGKYIEYIILNGQPFDKNGGTLPYNDYYDIMLANNYGSDIAINTAYNDYVDMNMNVKGYNPGHPMKKEGRIEDTFGTKTIDKHDKPEKKKTKKEESIQVGDELMIETAEGEGIVVPVLHVVGENILVGWDNLAEEIIVEEEKQLAELRKLAGIEESSDSTALQLSKDAQKVRQSGDDHTCPSCKGEKGYEMNGNWHDCEACGGKGVTEAEYQGREVKLNKPTRGDVKKFKVYVKDPKTGNIKKVNFGHGGSSAKKAGQKTMKIRKSNPKARKSFRARHNCDNPGPKTKARYWSCRKW